MKKQFNGCTSTAATEMAIVHRGDRRGTFFGSLAFSAVIPRERETTCLPNAYRKREAMSSCKARMTRGFYFIHSPNLALRRRFPKEFRVFSCLPRYGLQCINKEVQVFF